MSAVKKARQHSLYSEKNDKGMIKEEEPYYREDVEEELRLLLDGLTAIKDGDFNFRLPATRNGVIGEIVRTFNDIASIEERLTDEFSRISRIAGEEGQLTERASIGEITGSWKTKIGSLNSLISNLAQPAIEVANVITSVAEGNLSRKMALEINGKPVKGEFLRIGNTVNTMVDQLSAFAAEVTRVAREVGTEGKLGGQAEVKGVAGVWSDLTDNVNMMANNLTSQVRNIAQVTTAVANGDLSQKITVEVKGEILELKNTINTMVDQLNAFASEVTRVAREVGTEGKLGGQAAVKGVAGAWKDLTDNVNIMANNLTSQVRNIAQVTTAVATGDLSRKITIDAKGEILELKNTMNIMVDQLNAFAAEVTRVAREVGTEGKLGGQAEVKGVAGVWSDLTDNVNMMANNLTSQVRNIAQVTTAVANGDLSQKITVDVKGEILELKNTINTMVDQLNAFASEVTRVAREVGTEGKLGGQAEVKGVAGVWSDLTSNVNIMATNLTVQLRDVSKVATAIANGDLTQKITVDVKGEILQIKDVINKMVDQLNAFASEVTRVAREVGIEGTLGGQAEVKGVSGAWKDLTNNVNMLAGNLTDQVRNIAKVTTAVANGDLSQKITVEVKGEILELKNTMNTMVDQLNAFASEVTRVAREVGTEGKLGGQADVKGVAGVWSDLTSNVNMMAGNLTDQVRNIAKVAIAIANGDLSQKITVEVKGEILELKNTINTMVDQLNAFAAEVTRVAREVGTEGKLGGQAAVKGVAGVWSDLTSNVNMMAGNLTDQVRNIAKVALAIARGDLSQKITVEARGEILELKDTINAMVDNLNAIIGGINEVMSMVAEGALTRLIDVEAAGEFASMVEGINGTVESLQRIVSELKEAGVNIGQVSQSMLNSGQEMNAMVMQLSSSIDQIAGGAKTQAVQINEATKESEGVGQTASNTLQSTQNMNEVTGIASNSTVEGSKAMQDTIKNTDLMLEGSTNSVNSIESLSKSNEQIQEIVDIIRDIATQTNILAINAAIEAVRAGKQGKGFAVVAEEVKTLSADSKTQAKQISTLVQSVQKETQATVETIKTMAKNVETGKASIEQTSKAFSDIKSAIESSSQTSQKISKAAEDQKRSIDAISKSLDKVSGISADTSSNSEQSADSAKRLTSKMQELTATATNLADMSNRFQQTVQRFTIEEAGTTARRFSAAGMKKATSKSKEAATKKPQRQVA